MLYDSSQMLLHFLTNFGINFNKRTISNVCKTIAFDDYINEGKYSLPHTFEKSLSDATELLTC